MNPARQKCYSDRLLDGDLLCHAVGKMRLSILCIGKEAHQDVVSRREVSGEVLGHPRLDASDSTDRFRRRWSFHLVHPLHELGLRRSGIELDQLDLVMLLRRVVDANRARSRLDWR